MSQTHGIGSTYSTGCRCSACCAANTERHRRTRAMLKARPTEAVPHGTESAYTNWGCRCEPCKAAGSRHNLRMRLNRQARAQARAS